MRSIAAKFTLAFLLVGLTGTVLILVTLFIQIRSAFNQFVVNQFQQTVVNNLMDYYQAHGNSWSGVSDHLSQLISIPPTIIGGFQVSPEGAIPYTLLNADQKVIQSNSGDVIDHTALNHEPEHTIPLKLNGDTIGWLKLTFFSKAALPNSPEEVFFSSTNRAISISALGSMLLAVILGGLFALTMTRSIRELTVATDEMAQGKLGQQVKIRSQDELGKLAASFNKMSREVAHSIEQRRQMTADIAHDLRTPLSVLSGYAETLSDNSLDATPEVFAIMYQETQHLSRLVDDLRTLSLADAGELALYPEPVNLADYLGRVALRHAVNAEAKGVEIRIIAEPPLLQVCVDAERFFQVFDNLLTNALRYTPQGGKIALIARPSGDSVQVIIRDNGSGIDPEDLPRIFDRFYRGDPSRPEDGESGLGLAIGKSIVEAHGGKISVESTPGHGTTFTITLPRTT